MPFKQQVFALLVSLLVFVFTIEMVRQKRLREEYSVLWLFTSCIMFVLVIKYDWLVTLTNLIGAALPTSTLFTGSIVFLVLLGVQFSIKISRLSDQVKDLVQENAILRHQFEKIVKTRGTDLDAKP
ncbi:DUF2304 domain-containing protein [Geobacter argillaceus]|uniref:DUF2304 domain-containing protein n=1 Tax=Geobacter argillaceus TaxID=345631 RepID=A0A562WT24_9BACT|nr:DUF2304 domain-containing protein [Geobacter argillaceus]TWJ32594.1 hypothetical protein JN12_01036 [Geobacter argillaceus]